MWPFKKRGVIIITCRFPRFCNEDQEFIVKVLRDNIAKKYGSCYDLDIKLNKSENDKDSVTIEKYVGEFSSEREQIEKRATQIKILSQIRKLK